MSEQQTVIVAVDAPLVENLTYLQNDGFTVKRGDVVIVSLGKRQVSGVVVNTLSEIPKFELKAISTLNADLPALTEAHLKWLEWISDYYIYPLGQVAQPCFPPLEKTKQIRKSSRPSVIPDV